MRIIPIPGVFRPLSDTRLLAAHAARHAPGATVLDMCTGSGYVAVSAAQGGAREVTAVDVSRRAVLAAHVNARVNGVRVRALRGDLFAPVAGERFDLVVCNPPYVPAADGRVPKRGPERAWDAGADGRALLDRICDEVPRVLAPGGRVLLVHSSVCGEAETRERLSAGGLRVQVVDRHGGPLGPLLAGRAQVLEARGLLAPGQREEEVLVICGRRPSARSVRRAAAMQRNQAAPQGDQHREDGGGGKHEHTYRFVPYAT